MNSRKADCTLTGLNFELEPVGRVAGLIQLFEHDYDDFTFWHGVVAIEAESGAQLKMWFEYGRREDLKIRVELETGEIAISKLVFMRVTKDQPFDIVTVGLTGLNEIELQSS